MKEKLYDAIGFTTESTPEDPHEHSWERTETSRGVRGGLIFHESDGRASFISQERVVEWTCSECGETYVPGPLHSIGWVDGTARRHYLDQAGWEPIDEEEEAEIW